jgi:hypothetical protein
MSVQTLPQRSTNIRQAIIRSSWLLGLGLLIVAAVLGVYRLNSAPATPAPAVGRAQALPIDPAVQSVLDYLRAHSSVQPLPTPAVPLDPAQQSVMDYLRSHESAERSSTTWDQAVQAVLDYLQAHSR